jgi:hypothetical protein
VLKRALNRWVVLGVAVAIFVLAVGGRTEKLRGLAHPDAIGVLLVTDDADVDPSVRAAWERSLVEAGIPHRWMSADDAALLERPRWVGTYPVVILPDRLARTIPEALESMLGRYVSDGGTLVVVDDAGTRRANGSYRIAGLFAPLLGVHYLRYQGLRGRAFGRGPIAFTSEAAAMRWHVPFGKLDRERRLSTYHYGAVTYPLAATRVDSGVRVDAMSALGAVLTERAVGRGHAVYADPPLGYLRAQGDGFLQRALLDTIVFDQGAVPHVVAAEGGVGGLVVNWHIDSNNEWSGIPNLIRSHLVRPDLRFNWDVTAGPDLDKPGDGMGFDACGAGKKYLLQIARYGSIGSHGGWLHNGFAYGIEQHRLSFLQIRALVARNNECLSSVLHRPIVDYAAPDGAHPQPEMTVILTTLGIRAYYGTGDTGMPAELPFFLGHSVSSSEWAFPIEPLGRFASIAEMRRGHVAPAGVGRWLEAVIDSSERDRADYLVYSHSYDMEAHQYVAPVSAAYDRLERDQRAGRVRVVTMGDASAFLRRMVQVQMHFARRGDSYAVHLAQPDGLHGIAFAIPRLRAGTRVAGAHPVGTDAVYSYLAVDGDPHVFDAVIPQQAFIR